ncbi:hypothetical protein HUS23_13080 [Ectothiorhodospiraceae bacterium 2226]|nr:hypothetical protein HUS23_13080 [Ectothiorhodospiraceae bacterium 2226]
MRSKPVFRLGGILFAALLLAGCQDQQTPGEDPMDAPMMEPGAQGQNGADGGQVAAAAPPGAPGGEGAGEEQVAQAEEGAADEANPQRLFEQHCSVCHTLDLPRSQRLNLQTWRDVVDDMVDFGMTWVSEEEQELIIEYLAENYGPGSPR